MRLISILGYDRSGTTFLGKYLSSFSNQIFYAGEIDKGIEKWFSGKRKFCSCGKRHSECPIWGKVFPAMSSPDDIETLFNELKKETKAPVIIDSSKDFKHIRKCREILKDNFFSIHVKRNPKGVIFSRMTVRKSRVRRKTHPKPKLARWSSLLLVYDSLEWNCFNLKMEKFKRSDKIKNLDLVYDLWENELERKSRLFLRNLLPELNSSDNYPDHVVWGNRGRFKDIGKIKISQKWKRKMNPIQRNTVDLITFPVRLCFRYHFK